MRRSPMKRGKGAGVSDMPTQLRKLGAWLLENDLDMKAPDGTCDPRDAADTIEALQQRCEDREQAANQLGQQLHETELALQDSDGAAKAAQERIAALEGALEQIADGNLGGSTGMALAAAMRLARQTLSAREAPGESILDGPKPGRGSTMDTEPIHGTGRQSEEG